MWRKNKEKTAEMQSIVYKTTVIFIFIYFFERA